MANVGGNATLVLGEEGFDLAEVSGGQIPSDPMIVIEHHWEAARDVARSLAIGTGGPLDAGALRSPIPAPRSIFGLVANYPPAILPTPPVPMVFGKFPSAVVGPFDDVRLPPPALLPMQANGRFWRPS
jgi:2-keto-4-pentenoate hydratase/2-oxohepta-3-ene-1,7-dioic acid hydratase in catechol pathway